MNKEQGQVLGILEGIYSRVQYLGEEREFEECKRSNQGIQKGILTGYRRYGKARTQRRKV